MSLVCFWNNMQTVWLEQGRWEGMQGGENREVKGTQITVSDRAGGGLEALSRTLGHSTGPFQKPLTSRRQISPECVCGAYLGVFSGGSCYLPEEGNIRPTPTPPTN